MILRRGCDAAGMAAPAILLALVPKCPMCMAAYIALWTGLGISVTGAAYLRSGMLALCGASAVFWVVVLTRRLMKRAAKEAAKESCV